MPTKENAIEALLSFSNVMHELGLPFMLDGGTLLGAVRDGDFCEDDHDDIDLTTFISSEHIPDILHAASVYGFTVYHTWTDGEQQTAQLSVKRDDVKIDLMFKKRKNGKVWWTVYRGSKKTYKAVPDFANDSAQVAFHGGAFSIPSKVEEYLTTRYGDWKTPVHRKDYSCYTSDKCIVNPNTYESI